MKNLFASLFIALLFSACTPDCQDQVDVSDVKETLDLKRLDQSLRQANTPEKIAAFWEDNPLFADYLLSTTFPDRKIAEQSLLKMASNPSFDPLLHDIDSVFADFSTTHNELELLFKRTKVLFPSFSFPQVNTVYTGFGGLDLTQGEDLVIIGLDYFLGPKARFKPNDFPEYIQKYYYKENIPYKVALLLSKRFNESNPKDLTLLSYMIYYGKAFYFTKQVLPCLENHEVVEYTQTEYQDAVAHSSIIWSHFIDKQLFFETKRVAISKYVDERPQVFEIGDKCPGRIGRWLGYEIVKKYMENHPEVSLTALMNETDNQKILKESKYKP